MSGGRSPGMRRLAGAALALYPPSWRARYGDEVQALLDESGADLPTAASLAGRALPAWIWPVRQVHDRPARMRASLSTVLLAWTVMTGLALIFVQLTEAQGLNPPGHPVITWCYWAVNVAVLVSVLTVAAGGLPLWLLMMRKAIREHRQGVVACLLAPVVVPVCYLAAVALTTRLAGHANGVGPGWFLALAALGFAAGVVFAAGPGLALRQLRPRGPAVALAARVAAVATAAMILAGAASIIAAAGLYLWARDYAGYRETAPLAIYLPLVLVPTVVAAVSAGRGLRAARQTVS
jgi:uncharacterized membrane protein YozB (DUF420 family)